MINQQLYTSWDTSKKKKLKIILRKNPIRKLKPQEILVKNIYVPIHGSFWLASDPNLKHPRIDEFMNKGGFVFGNGGIAQVIKSSPYLPNVKKGDFVSIFGHTPWKIMIVMPVLFYTVILNVSMKMEKFLDTAKVQMMELLQNILYCHLNLTKFVLKVMNFQPKKLMPMMLSFLVADVRNALTRLPDVLKSQRMMLFGAWIFWQNCSLFVQHVFAWFKNICN